jgi:hypothetical protein
MPTNAYYINHLCDISGVTPRTVYYYVQQGLLPPPGARGPGARYDRRHLLRLQLIGKPARSQWRDDGDCGQPRHSDCI